MDKKPKNPDWLAADLYRPGRYIITEKQKGNRISCL